MNMRIGNASLVLFLGILSPSMLRSASADPGKPIIDNERVTVWDVTSAPGRNGSVPRPEDDSLTIYLGGSVNVARSDGKSRIVKRSIGEAVFHHKGTKWIEETPASGSSLRSIVIDLKNHPVPPIQNRSGYPAAFPRPGIKKILENKRVIVWDYTWLPGVPTPMHFHDKDVVVVYLENGALKSTTPEGRSVVNPNSFGYTKFNARNRVHTEELIKGQDRAIIVELK